MIYQCMFFLHKYVHISHLTFDGSHLTTHFLREILRHYYKDVFFHVHSQTCMYGHHMYSRILVCLVLVVLIDSPF